MERLNAGTCRSLTESYSTIYDQNGMVELEEQENIFEFFRSIDELVEEGYDLSEYDYDQLYEYCINEGGVGSLLKLVGKVAGKALRPVWAGAKPVLKKGLEKTGKLAVPVAATAAADQYLTGGKGREYAGAAIDATRKAGNSIPSPGDLKLPGLPAKVSPADNKDKDKNKPSVSKLYDSYMAICEEPLTVSGGRTGTGTGANFKARDWSQAEVDRYKKVKGPEGLKKDQAAYTKAKEVQKSKTTTTTPAANTNPKVAPSKPVTPAKPSGMDIWKAKYKDTLAKKVNSDGTQMGTGKSKMERDAAELRSMQADSRERQGVSPTTGATSAVVDKTDADNAMKNFKPRDMSKNPLKKESYNAYDLVLEYILSQGHAETIAEAHYVMMEMDAEMIGDIVESYIR
jgi:hypothetical protein